MGKFLTNKNYKKKYFQKNLFRNKKFFPSNFSRRIRLNRWLLYRFNKQKRYSFLKLFKLAKINTRILKHIFLKKVLKNEVRLKSFLFFNRKKFVRLIKCSGLYKVSKKYNYTRKKLYFLRFNFKGINKKSLRKKIKKKKLLRDLKPKFLWPSESLNSDKFILQTNKKNSKSYLLLRREKFYK
jgi:hypothetical protein